MRDSSDSPHFPFIEMKAMRTRAVYDAETREYVLHTPDFEAAKCWAGNLGSFAYPGSPFQTLACRPVCS